MKGHEFYRRKDKKVVQEERQRCGRKSECIGRKGQEVRIYTRKETWKDIKREDRRKDRNEDVQRKEGGIQGNKDRQRGRRMYRGKQGCTKGKTEVQKEIRID